MENRFTLLTICLLTVFLLLIKGGVDGLQCFSCSNIADASTCTGVSQCQYGESCFQHVENIGGDAVNVSMGCTGNQNCGTQQSGASVPLGYKRQTRQCNECCTSDYCNKYLCGQAKYGACTDDIKVDCAFMNTISNICGNTELAERVCRNFCGFCSAGKDGNWSEWSIWSSCDVTFGTGTQSRSRMCSSPAPPSGVRNCNGSRIETRTCTRQACPESLVCYSCDYGPASSLCYGETTVQCPSGHACFSQFSTTGMGGSGTHGCTEISNCNDIRSGDHTWHVNNSSNIVGRDIVRNKRGYGYCFQCCYHNKCNTQACSPMLTPGSWGSWTAWSSCDVTCGNGTQSRHRACDMPRPSDPRLYCAGNSTETKTCQQKLCHEPLKCYACTVGWTVARCDTTSTCQAGEVCFVNLISAGMGISYDLGCTVEENCKNGSFVEVPPGLTHRWDCCHTSLCNKHNLF